MKVKRTVTSRRLKILKRKYNIPGIERVLGLPQGSFVNIINRKVFPTPEDRILVKLIYLFPELITIYDLTTNETI